MSHWEGLNRRKFPRIKYPCLVVIRSAQNSEEGQDGFILTHTENIGIGGAGVVLKSNIPLFATVGIEIDLLDLGPHIRCNGKIVWNVQRQGTSKEKAHYYDLGIEFRDLNKGDYERLKKAIDLMVGKNKA